MAHWSGWGTALSLPVWLLVHKLLQAGSRGSGPGYTPYLSPVIHRTVSSHPHLSHSPLPPPPVTPLTQLSPVTLPSPTPTCCYTSHSNLSHSLLPPHLSHLTPPPVTLPSPTPPITPPSPAVPCTRWWRTSMPTTLSRRWSTCLSPHRGKCWCTRYVHTSLRSGNTLTESTFLPNWRSTTCVPVSQPTSSLSPSEPTDVCAASVEPGSVYYV